MATWSTFTRSPDTYTQISPASSTITDTDTITVTASPGYLIQSVVVTFKYGSGTVQEAKTMGAADGQSTYSFKLGDFATSSNKSVSWVTVASTSKVDPNYKKSLTSRYVVDQYVTIPRYNPLQEGTQLNVTLSSNRKIKTFDIVPYIGTTTAGTPITITGAIGQTSYPYTVSYTGWDASYDTIEIRITTEPLYYEWAAEWGINANTTVAPTQYPTVRSTDNLTFSANAGYLLNGVDYTFYQGTNVLTYGVVPNSTNVASKSVLVSSLLTSAQLPNVTKVKFTTSVITDPAYVTGSANYTTEYTHVTGNITGSVIKDEDTLVLTADPGYFFHTNDDIDVYFEMSAGVFEGNSYRVDTDPSYFNKAKTVFTVPMLESWHDHSIRALIRAIAEDWNLYPTFLKQTLTKVKSNVSGTSITPGTTVTLTVDDVGNLGYKLKDVTVFTIIDNQTTEITYNILTNPEYFNATATQFTYIPTAPAGKKLREVSITAEAKLPTYQLELAPGTTLIEANGTGTQYVNHRLILNTVDDSNGQRLYGFNGDIVLTFLVNGRNEVVRFNRVENPEYFNDENSVFNLPLGDQWPYDNITEIVTKVTVSARANKQRLVYDDGSDYGNYNLARYVTPFINWNFRLEVLKDVYEYFDTIVINYKKGDMTTVEALSFTRLNNPENFAWTTDSSGNSVLMFVFDMAQHWDIVQQYEGTSNEIVYLSPFITVVEEGVIWNGDEWVLRTDADRDKAWGAPPATGNSRHNPETQEIDTFPFVYGVNDSKTFTVNTEPIYSFPNPEPPPLDTKLDSDNDGVPDDYDPEEPTTPLTDAEKIALDKGALTLGDTSAVTSGITLSTRGSYGSTITWTSSKPTVVSTSGAVTRPSSTSGDAMVTLAATLTLGAEQLVKEFLVVVKALPPSGGDPDRDGDGIPDSTDPYPDDPTNTPPGGEDPEHPPGSTDANYYENLQNASSNIETIDIGNGTRSGDVSKDIPLVLRANTGFDFKDVIRILLVRDGTTSTTVTFYPNTESDAKYFSENNTKFTVLLNDFWLKNGMDNVYAVNIYATATEQFIDDDPTDVIGGQTTTFANVYSADSGVLARLATQRFGAALEGVQTDFGQYIYKVYKFPLKIDPKYISTGSVNIQLGYYTIQAQSKYFHKSRLKFSLGTITVDEKYSNIYDYKDTTCLLHVPYSAPIEIDPTYVIGQEIELVYYLDLYNGTVTFDVYSSKIDGGLALRQDIQASYEIPFVKPQYNDVKGEVGRYVNNQIKTPYVEVVRNIPYDAQTEFGKAGIGYGQLNTFTGYVEVPDVNLESTASEVERDQIKQLLASGVFIN